MKRIPKLVVALMAVLLLSAACGDDDEEAASTTDTAATTTNDGADEIEVSFASPEDGAEVTSPVHVVMEAEGITIEPAGQVRDGYGHFHVMADVDCVEPGQVIPVETDGYNHFGKGQTEADLELAPGEHTLCLQVGDGAHTALDASDEITITVTG